MAERKIASAAMEVDLFAEVSHSHRSAFDMPAWPPSAEARRPGRLVRPRTSPQREIQSIALGPRSDGAEQSLIAQLTHHRPARAMRQPPISGIPTRIEIQGVGLIRIAGGVKPRSRLEDAVNLL